MLAIEDIDLDLNVRDILVYGSALGHEKNRIGARRLCRKYKSNIRTYRCDLPHEWFCYLLAYLKYIDPSFQYDSSVRLRGYMAPADVCFYIRYEIHDMYDLDVLWNEAIPCFRERGFLLSQVDEAV